MVLENKWLLRNKLGKQCSSEIHLNASFEKKEKASLRIFSERKWKLKSF